MADINIERKGSSVWPWIIGLVVLAVVVWGVMQYFDGRNDAAVAPADSAAVQQPAQYAPAPVPVITDTVPDSAAVTSTTSQ